MRAIGKVLVSLAGVLVATASGVLATSGSASAAPSWSSDAFNTVASQTNSDWMRGLPSSASLGSLTLPGTHDTLSIHGGSFFPSAYETQQNYGDGGATLAVQLNAGIRAIDIRVRVIGGAFTIHHTDIYQKANFDDVLTKSRDFLNAHPTETVLMKLHGECDANTTEGGSGSGSVGHCADDPSNITEADRKNIFRNYLSRYPNLFYAPSVTGNSTAAMPTVGQARGKIVLGDFTGPRGQVYGGYGLSQLTTGNWGQYVTNNWTECNYDNKWNLVRTNMTNANNDTSGAMYTSFASANCAPFGATPADVAGSINQRILDHLNAGGLQDVGVVMLDYPGHALIAALIRHQRGQLTGPVWSWVGGSKCLDNYGGSTSPGGAVDTWTCNGSAAQSWTVHPDRTVRNSGLCLDVAGGSSANGAAIQLWTCTGGNNQKWTASAGGTLVGLQSGKCLDVPGSSTADGTRLVLWQCGGGANQRWSLP